MKTAPRIRCVHDEYLSTSQIGFHSVLLSAAAYLLFQADIVKRL